MRTHPPAEPMERVLVIKRAFEAPARVISQAWTRKDQLLRWWAPKGFTTPWCELDVRPGGTFRVCMRSPDGREHWSQGIFLEIVDGERILFTSASEDAQGRPGHETLVTVTLIEEDGKTKLTLYQAVFESVAARNAQKERWLSSLDRLAEHVTPQEHRSRPGRL